MKHIFSGNFLKFFSITFIAFFFMVPIAAGEAGIHIRLKISIEKFIEANGCRAHLNNPLPITGSVMRMACLDAVSLLKEFNDYEKFDPQRFELNVINFLYHLSDQYQERGDWATKTITLRLTQNNRLFQNGVINSNYTSGWEKIAPEEPAPSSIILKKDSNFQNEKQLLARLNNRIIYNSDYMQRNPSPSIKRSLIKANELLVMTRLCNFSFCNEKKPQTRKGSIVFQHCGS